MSTPNPSVLLLIVEGWTLAGVPLLPLLLWRMVGEEVIVLKRGSIRIGRSTL